MESTLHHQARNSPYRFVLLSYDDTEDLQLPRFTNRPVKYLPNAKINFCPFGISNHGAYENNYIYTMSHCVSKGANRLCTTLYHYLKRMKEKQEVDAEGNQIPGVADQKKARRLILMADNFSENKCNTLFAFLSHLIYLDWFDTVELYYGPVGHTHNGNDSCHNVHNNVAGDTDSVTLGDFCNKFTMAWNDPKARPQPVFLENTYNWDSFYSHGMKHISGFTKTAYDEPYVRAIKLEKNDQGFVELMYKGSPTRPTWMGVGDGVEEYQGSQGFVVLKSVPRGTPEPIDTDGRRLGQEHAKAFNHALMQAHVESTDHQNGLDWCKELLETNKLPSLGPVRDFDRLPAKAKGWGEVEAVGVRGHTFNIPIIRSPKIVSEDRFWKLPETVDDERRKKQERLRELSEHSAREPSLYYRGKKPAHLTSRLPGASAPTSSCSSDPLLNPTAAVSNSTQSVSKSSSSKKGRSQLSEDSDNAARHRRQKAGRREDPVVVEDDDDWGCELEDCRVGRFAAVHSLYDKKHGLSLVRVYLLV